MDTIEDGVPMSLGGTRPLPRVLSLLAAVAALTVACGGGGVRIAFRPQPGTRYEYVVTVHSTVKTQLGDQPAQNDDEETVLRATHTVLRSQRAGLVRVRVQLRTPGGTTRTFVVDLDRAAQLDAIETIEGLPAQVFGNLRRNESPNPGPGHANGWSTSGTLLATLPMTWSFGTMPVARWHRVNQA